MMNVKNMTEEEMRNILNLAEEIVNKGGCLSKEQWMMVFEIKAKLTK